MYLGGNRIGKRYGREPEADQDLGDDDPVDIAGGRGDSSADERDSASADQEEFPGLERVGCE